MLAGRHRPTPGPRPAEMTVRDRLARTQLYLIATLRLDGPLASSPMGFEADVARIAAAVAGGVQAVQLRAKSASARQLHVAVRALRGELPADCLILVNDEVEGAIELGGRPVADGVHLGRKDASAFALAPASHPDRRGAGFRRARELLGDELLLGASTRSHEEFEHALASGCDHAGFGAMFPSSTKADTTPASADELARLTEQYPSVPIFPIGGLDAERIAQIGARRAAVGSAILAAEDPAAAARACRDALAPLQT